jgi:hypothetical protein
MLLQEDPSLAQGLRRMAERAQRRQAGRIAFEGQLTLRKASLVLGQRRERNLGLSGAQCLLGLLEQSGLFGEWR